MDFPLLLLMLLERRKQVPFHVSVHCAIPSKRFLVLGQVSVVYTPNPPGDRLTEFSGTSWSSRWYIPPAKACIFFLLLHTALLSLNVLRTSQWPESANDLYRPNDSRLSKLKPTSVEIGCRVVSTTDPYRRILGFLDRSRYFFFHCTHEAEWTPFQTHYFSENLEAPGIEPGPLDL
jgi:hypothetical protein